jgi:uncharacterized membrane protein YdbT with pleckstrin-like domain
MHSTVGRTRPRMLYNAALSQQRPKSNPASSAAAQGITITPSAKLLKPFYWAAAIMAGLILAYSNNMNLNLYPLLVVPGAVLLFALGKHVRLRFTRLIVASGKLRFESGLFSRSVRTMELAKVQNARVDQTFMERLLGLGTVSIETAGETSLMTMKGVEAPQQVADYILEAAGK